MKPVLIVLCGMAVCGVAPRLAAATRAEVKIGAPQSTLAERPPADPKEVERGRALLRSLTTLDLIGSTEEGIRRMIPFDPTPLEKDERTWYLESSIIRHGDIIGRFRVLTFTAGKVTKHEIIDRIIGCALPLPLKK